MLLSPFHAPYIYRISPYINPLCAIIAVYRAFYGISRVWLRWRRDPDPALGQIAPRGSRRWASIILPDLLRSRCGSTGPSCGSPGPWGPPYTPSGSLPGPMASSATLSGRAGRASGSFPALGTDHPVPDHRAGPQAAHGEDRCPRPPPGPLWTRCSVNNVRDQRSPAQGRGQTPTAPIRPKGQMGHLPPTQGQDHARQHHTPPAPLRAGRNVNPVSQKPMRPAVGNHTMIAELSHLPSPHIILRISVNIHGISCFLLAKGREKT